MANQIFAADALNAFCEASVKLQAAIRKAADNFYAHPPEEPDRRRSWHSASPPGRLALPEVERYYRVLSAAVAAYEQGDIRTLARIAAMCGRLAKDMDFDMRWMTRDDWAIVDAALDDLLGAAEKIQRSGYVQLQRLGLLED